MHSHNQFFIVAEFLFAAVLLLLYGNSAHAHVQYVIPPEVFAEQSGMDNAYLFSALGQPSILLYGVFFAISCIIFIFFLKHSLLFLREIASIRKEAQTYQELIPWMIRLTLGMAFIGVGTGGFFISPTISATNLEAFLQILIGFFFLTGFFLTPGIIGSIILYGLMLGKEPIAVIGTLDVAALMIIFLLKANARPGIDALLGIPMIRAFQKYDAWAPCILRSLVGLSFIALALFEKILNPHWAEYVAIQYQLSSIIPVSSAIWVLGAGAIELLIGAFLIIGFQTRLVSAISFIVLSFSFFFFKEEVYSHITLFGALSILFVTGAGRASIDAWARTRYSDAIKNNV